MANTQHEITEQPLLTFLDSPLNKAGQLQVYIYTAKGTFIEVNPHVRIPRKFKRISGFMGALIIFTSHLSGSTALRPPNLPLKRSGMSGDLHAVYPLITIFPCLQ